MTATVAFDRTITVELLTTEAFAPFGDVLETWGDSFPINGGMCDRFHDRARTEITGEGGRLGISLGFGRPYALPLRVATAGGNRRYPRARASSTGDRSPGRKHAPWRA